MALVSENECILLLACCFNVELNGIFLSFFKIVKTDICHFFLAVEYLSRCTCKDFKRNFQKGAIRMCRQSLSPSVHLAWQLFFLVTFFAQNNRIGF